jgi:putative hemolysin
VQAILASLIAVLAPLIFCLAMFDIALRSIQYYRISAIERHGNEKAARLFSLLSSPEHAVSVLLFLRYTLTAVLYLTAGILIYRAPLPLLSRCLLLGLCVALALILLEYVPRMLAVQIPDRIAFALLGPFAWTLKLNRLLPLPQAFERLASRLLRLYGFNVEKIFSEYSVNEIKMLLSLKQDPSDAELKKQTLDSKFLDFSGRRVREVMVPRPFVKSVEINTPLRTLLRLIQENGYSRMPVYRNTFDNILGILHVKDILAVAEPFSLESVIRTPFFVPEAATVRSAFQNMQRTHSHMAIVVDEYGGVDGIVTLEDLIEELIGEIQDEHDEEIQMLHPAGENHWILEGNLTIKELNQKLHLDLPEDSSYTTVAGFLLSILDKIPAEREQVRYGDSVFTIDRMMGHKIARVQVKLPQQTK